MVGVLTMFKITGDLISENLTCPPEMMGPLFKLSFTKSISSTSIVSKKKQSHALFVAASWYFFGYVYSFTNNHLSENIYF